MFQYVLHPESDIPIYRQLADQMNAEIRSGVLKTGTKLPTVREMAAQMHLSCGTVKRVYDRLAELGDIEMTRRRGTFVKYVRENPDSRKIQAMAAIDRMLRQLTDLNFSPAEIQIFVGLKMREWGVKGSTVRLGLVSGSGEIPAAVERQLGRLTNVHFEGWATEQVLEYPYNLDEQADLILTSAGEAQRLRSALPEPGKLVRVAFALDDAARLRLAQVDGEVGVCCGSEEVISLIRSMLHRELRTLTADEAKEWPGVVVADRADELEALRDEKRLILPELRLDEGSLLHLEERIRRIREERQLHPAANMPEI